MTNKKQLMSSAPWRGEKEEEFSDAKLKVTKQPGGTSTMHVPRKKSVKSKSSNDKDDDSITEIDPELRYSFQRNYQFLQRVFSIDTLVKPLPPAMAYNVSRNLSFFTRIFTQFFDPEGIANAQKSLWARTRRESSSSSLKKKKQSKNKKWKKRGKGTKLLYVNPIQSSLSRTYLSYVRNFDSI